MVVTREEGATGRLVAYVTQERGKRSRTAWRISPTSTSGRPSTTTPTARGRGRSAGRGGRSHLRHPRLEQQLHRGADPGRGDARVGGADRRAHSLPAPPAGSGDRLRHRPAALPGRPAYRSVPGDRFLCRCPGGIRRQLDAPGELPRWSCARRWPTRWRTSAAPAGSIWSSSTRSSSISRGRLPGAGAGGGGARPWRPGGAVFLGDLRSLPLLEALHTSVELFQAADAMPVPSCGAGSATGWRRGGAGGRSAALPRPGPPPARVRGIEILVKRGHRPQRADPLPATTRCCAWARSPRRRWTSLDGRDRSGADSGRLEPSCGAPGELELAGLPTRGSRRRRRP